MIEHIESLDQAVEYVLEKATANNRAHITAATMSQDDHDKHADALAHHAAAIMHYRNKPEVKKALEQIGSIVPHRSYINKPLKLDQTNAPQISVEDLNHEHPAIKGRDDANKQQLVKALNAHLDAAHKAFHASNELKALNSHSKRFLAHMSAMLEWHNLQKKGEGAHHQFSGHIAGPELEDNHSDSRFRGHSTPSATDRTKFRTQSITKAGGAKWHPGLPELTSLEEVGGHPSAGKMKELYPFHEIKVNGEPLAEKKFKGEPEEIHEQDYATNLTKDHKVKMPDGTVTNAIGGYHGSKSAAQNMEGMSRVGMFKKSQESEISSYFPDATVAHIILAKNLIEVMNPYASMTDEGFGEYVAVSLSKSLSPSEQAALLVEASNRLEKAVKKPGNMYRVSDSEHAKGIQDVLAGHVTPLPMTDAGERTVKEGEKRNEVEDIEQMTGQPMKRSPYAVPKEVFTDDTYAKVDPEKYKQWVAGKPTEQDHRNMMATYQQVIRHNPEAQARHKAFVDLHREQARSGLGRSASGETQETPIVDHRAALAQAGKDLASGKITAQEFAEINSKASQARKEGVAHKASSSEMTPDEKKVTEADPSYKPKRPSAAGKAEAASMKDLTSIAQGKIPSHMLADKADLGHQDDEHTESQAREMVGGKGADGEGVASGSITQAPSPIQLIADHPGLKSYLKMKEHLLGHYKNPAVRQYMEEKINQHENNPNLDVDKLAATFHFLHRARNKSMQIVLRQDTRYKLNPEEAARFDEVKANKQETTPGMMPENAPATDPTRTAGLKTADPEYKKKLMAEIQARENAKKPK